MKTKLIFIICPFLTSFTFAQTKEQTISKQAEELLQDAIGKGIFSGVVIIAKEGKQIFKKQYGYSDWNTKRPIEENTLYNIGSLNKQFTEEIIHQLVKEKKIGYDTTLNKYLDLFPNETGKKITIRQLLEMRSGLGDYMRSPNFKKVQETDFTLNDLLAIIKSQPLLFEPGTNRAYSNSGYVVLGAVIEKVTGKTYEENLRERIVTPLDLKNIYYTRAQKLQKPNRAFGTTINFEGEKQSVDDTVNSAPDGSIYTDTKDLLNFVEAKRKNILPSAKGYKPGTFAGGTQAWNAAIGYNEKGFSFIIMANVSTIADELAARINLILDGEPFPPLELPFEMTLYKTLSEKGIDCIETNIKQLCKAANRPYDDRFLNFFGYQLLNSSKTDMAIKIFTLNTKLFPTIANTYDSLAEAYLKNGDKENALECYNKLLRLDPGNERVKNTIKEINIK